VESSFLRYKKNEFYNLNGINSEKEGMSIWTYTSKNAAVIMQLLTVFYSLICLSDRTTHVKCSMINIKPTQTLYTLLRYISPVCLIKMLRPLSRPPLTRPPDEELYSERECKWPSNSWPKLRRKWRIFYQTILQRRNLKWNLDNDNKSFAIANADIMNCGHNYTRCIRDFYN